MISYDINIYIILQYYYLHSYVCTKVHDKIWIPSFVLLPSYLRNYEGTFEGRLIINSMFHIRLIEIQQNNHVVTRTHSMISAEAWF